MGGATHPPITSLFCPALRPSFSPVTSSSRSSSDLATGGSEPVCGGSEQFSFLKVGIKARTVRTSAGRPRPCVPRRLGPIQVLRLIFCETLNRDFLSVAPPPTHSVSVCRLTLWLFGPAPCSAGRPGRPWKQLRRRVHAVRAFVVVTRRAVCVFNVNQVN